jgi:site-specific recombinase XerD
MLKSGMNIAEVRVISGHKSLSQFQRYARIKPSDLLDKINQV